MLVEYVKDNYYASFHNPSYHRDGETYFSILLDIKILEYVKIVFISLAIIGTEKHTLLYFD